MRRADTLELADVIDLEVQLEADRALDPEALRTRDREIGLALEDGAKPAVLGAWLRALRLSAPEQTGLGSRMVRGARLLAALLVVLGLITGSGAAQVLMHFDGARPVNVLPILGLLVLLQIALWLLVLASVALAHFAPGVAASLPLVGDVRAVLRSAAGKIAARERRRGGAGARWVATVHRLRARSALHDKLELWWMTLIAQAFGIAFNIGAIAVMIVMPIVLKYSFCWSTTLELGPEALHRITTLLSWPWSFFAPGAVPSLELVRSTQFDILSGKYLTGPAPASGAWWPFLTTAVVFYGLLPRVFFAVISAVGLRRSLARLPLDTPDLEAVLRRLRSPLVETRGGAMKPPPVLSVPANSAVEPVQASALSCTVVSWRDLPLDRQVLEPWLENELGWSVASAVSAGGADFQRDDEAIRLAAEAALPVVIAAEAFEPPDKAVRRFLAGLRGKVGARTKVLVLLVSTSGSRWVPAERRDVQTWSEQLATLEDPYLGIESMSER